MADKEFIEKRRYPRLNVVIVAYSSPSYRETGSSRICVTKNISAGGICLILDEDIEVGAFLPLKIHLPDGSSPMDVKGKVVWKKNISQYTGSQRLCYDVGVEFIEITHPAQKKISDYVLKHLGE